MNFMFSDLSLWAGDPCYVTARADFLHHQIDQEQSTREQQEKGYDDEYTT
jgi:hypothetical protein